MFSFVCVSLFTGWGVPCDHYPWSNGPHQGPLPGPTLPWTWDLTVQVPLRPWTLPGHETLSPCVGTVPQPAPPPILTSSGHDWTPVQTGSLEDPRCWHLVATEAYTVGKRAIRILLEYFLVAYGCQVYGTCRKPICQQDSIPAECVPPAWQPYVFRWPRLDVSTGGGRSSSEQV